MRRIMKQLGAERTKPAPSDEDVEKRYRKPNEGAAKRPDPVAGERGRVKPDIVDKLISAAAGMPTAADITNMARAVIEKHESRQLAAADDDEAKADRIAAFHAQIEAIEDGIYFNLPDEIYHAVPRLGSGSICDLIVSAGNFWRGSWLDPDRPELDEESTDAQTLGKAYHTARLEPHLLDQKFVRKISKDDFPAKGMLTSDTAVRAALKALGETQTIGGETIAERCERLLDAGYQGTLMPLETAKWEATVNGRTPIPAEKWDDITRDMHRLRGNEEIAMKLEGGAAEVSIFWTDRHGLKCKCRPDYLRPDLWDDFKTFENKNRKVLAQAIADAVRFNRIYVQAIHYRDGIEMVRTGGLQIKGEASDAERALIASIQIRPFELECWLIFQEKKGIPNLLAKRFEFDSVPMREQADMAGLSEDRRAKAMAAMARPTQIRQLGEAEILKAKRDFVTYSQIYEPGQPWAPIEPIGTIGDLDFNSFWLEGRG